MNPLRPVVRLRLSHPEKCGTQPSGAVKPPPGPPIPSWFPALVDRRLQ